MVNRGRSKGCVTCKQRRVKCDEAKPECRHCQRLGLHCAGYNTEYASLKFKDQNHKFFTQVVQSRAAVPSPRSLAEPDTAVPFFLGHYASMGRYLGSARGFFEILIPVYCSERQDSPFSLALSAVASEILSLWRRSTRSFQSPRKSYTEAIACVRNAVDDHRERSNPATVLAVLVLQLYENIAAVYGLRPATRVHHNGAVSLLPFAEPDRINGTIGAYIRRFMLHTEVSSAMRQKRPLRSVAYSWIGGEDMKAAPDNPSSVLDVIGASVAEFQAHYLRLTDEAGSQSLSQQALQEWREEAKRIDEQLLDWARNVPDHWQPVKLTSGRDIDQSIPTYRSVCEVYPSCQIASIWNLWRFQRLLLVKITVDCLQTILNQLQLEPTKDRVSGAVDDLFDCQQTLQELVDSVCCSVPFYLGNRTKMSTIIDFTDPEILFPSCHPLVSGDKVCLNKQDHHTETSRDDHRRHVIAQGPWHVMSPLSRLLTLFSENNGELIASFLRPGQQGWIREQFLRVTTLLHLSPEEYSEDKQDLLNSPAEGSGDTNADYLARGVRKGLIFMSGP